MLRAARLSVLGLGIAATVFLTGCSSISSADIRRDPTPELFSQTNSREQFRNQRAMARNHAWRTMWDDLARIGLHDKNTQLTPWPTP